MNDAAHPLNRAYELIENGDLEAAQEVLDSIRDDHTDNPDFWWVYAHAVTDEAEGREALQRVRNLAPDYPGIENLSQQIDGIPEPSQIDSLAKKADQPPQPPDLPRNDNFDEFDDFVDGLDEPETESAASSNRTWLLALVGAVLIVIIGLALILNSGDDQTNVANVTPSVEPTEVIAIATDTTDSIPTMSPVERLTAAAESNMTEEPTAEPVSDSTEEVIDAQSAETLTFDELAETLADFEVPDDGVTTNETTFGNTLIITICAAPGPQSSSAIQSIVDVLAEQEDELAPDIEAIGFGITNCDTDTTRQVIGVERAVLQSYADDDITVQDVQRQLRPLG